MSIDYSTFAFPKPTMKVKVRKPLRNRSKKMAKLEKNRVSIITENMEECFICGRRKCDIHEVFGGMNRQKSIENGLVVPICRADHSNIRNYEEWLHRLGQKRFEETHSREEFIKEFGKSFI